MKVPGQAAYWGLLAVLTLLDVEVRPQSLPDQALDLLENVLDVTGEEDSPGGQGTIPDYADLVPGLFELQEEPLDLNSAGREDLGKLWVLNALQVFNLVAYRETYGDLLTLYELQAIDGFDHRTIDQLLPYVTVGTGPREYKIKPRHIAVYGKHRVLLRVQRVLEQRRGYGNDTGTGTLEDPGKHYLGTPERLFLRYGFNYRNRVRFGLSAEKDPGEALLPAHISDSIKTLLPAFRRTGFDYYSIHFYLSEIGVVKSFVAGDYHLSFGQGLTLSSARAFGGGGDATRIRRTREGITPHRGAEENLFFRGAAMTLEWQGLETTFFYSGNRVDALLVLDTLDGKEVVFARLDQTGHHRTISEMQKKNTLHVSVTGARISYRTRRLKVGLTGYQASYEFPLEKRPEVYHAFDFSGGMQRFGGLDYHFILRRISFFGEAAVDGKGAFAQLHGLTAGLHPALTFSLIYRNYGRGYRNPFSSAFAVGQQGNEQGIYSGLKAQLPHRIILHAYLDLHRFPWLKFMTDRPSRGKDMVVEFTQNPSKDVSVSVRIRQRSYQRNLTGLKGFTKPLQGVRKTNFRIRLDYGISPSVVLGNRLGLVLNQQTGAPPASGFLVIQDIRWKSKGDRFAVSLRYALFDTDSYNERIYAYEHDVLYAFTIPAYYYRGNKWIFLCRARISPAVDLWVRFARTWYANRSVIGSGLDEIRGNSLSELKIQLMVKV